MKQVSPDDLPYAVESIDILVELPDLVISEITVMPGQEVPWHYHNNVTDTFYGLSGCTSIQHGPDGNTKLHPGESVVVPSGTPHRVKSSGEGSCRFLLIQGIGKYDFVPAKAPAKIADE